MMNKGLLKFFLITLIIVLAGFFGVRAGLLAIAHHKADKLFSTNASVTAQNVFKNFHKDGYHIFGPLALIRPYWSSQHLPAFIRMPSGTLETVMGEGWCDDAARSLIYILGRHGIPAQQWNMMTSSGAHVAVLTGNNLVDPYYGFDTLMDPFTIRTQMQRGVPMDKFFSTFGADSRPDFYKDFAHVQMAAQGEPFIIPVAFPSNITLGSIDGSSEDVRSQSLEHGLTYVWTYIGHHYDRAWVRKFIARNAVKVEIILTSKPDEQVLRTLTPQPIVQGTKLTWDLLPKDEIISKDGDAGISLHHLNSYIPIDQIIVTPKGDSS